ncbi:transposable element Tcb1 transposase [Trichonephila clavipes]|uniref:Transposable element Tcb1 transposase n=1 Tax=Trichonephila clavipes TaxID=2585209 RepID=A0A8X6VPF6_TRICX|nr:transposable element Tcb1 transposase [Trichonephila clavipes]
MIAQRYVCDILQPHVLPLMQRLPEAIFQQDNSRPHTARVSQYCLRSVTTLPWPARSLDLSPMEHIWDHLGRRVGHPTSLNELEAGLQQIWNEMSQDILHNLYGSMPDRIALCIRARGGSTGSVLTYACETWSLSRTDEHLMSIYERKILRSIFGGIQENGTLRRSNLELYRSYKESDIVNFVKIQRIKWAGNVIRINDDRTTKKVFNAQPIGTRRKGRSNLK